uniref:Uncharacterized protein n=1 Tax=Cyanothece sp. (strain PCC 7425 / ATCC 29141) TaxID=395961 RepID=B8HNB8_CYAP4
MALEGSLYADCRNLLTAGRIILKGYQDQSLIPVIVLLTDLPVAVLAQSAHAPTAIVLEYPTTAANKPLPQPFYLARRLRIS